MIQILIRFETRMGIRVAVKTGKPRPKGKSILGKCLGVRKNKGNERDNQMINA